MIPFYIDNMSKKWSPSKRALPYLPWYHDLSDNRNPAMRLHGMTVEAPHGFHKAPLFCSWAPSRSWASETLLNASNASLFRVQAPIWPHICPYGHQGRPCRGKSRPLEPNAPLCWFLATPLGIAYTGCSVSRNVMKSVISSHDINPCTDGGLGQLRTDGGGG